MESNVLYRRADKSVALPGSKQANVFGQNGVNFLRRLALQGEKELDVSSRLDFVEVARVPGMLPSFFPFWSG